MAQVTDPELIQQLEALRLKQTAAPAPPPAAPATPGAVTDPVLIRQLEAERSGYMSPQIGEQWTAMTPKGRRQYRMTENGLESSALGWQKEAPGTLRGSGQKIGEWLPVTDEAERAEAAKSARARLPEMSYFGNGIGAGAEKFALDLATTNQKTQADFLVNNLTPDKGYMIVPVEDDRVMIVHKDPETGKVTRQLINAAGISKADLVNALPHLAAAAMTGGATAGLGVLGRAAAQGAVSGVVSASQEGGLKAAGSERDFDWMKVVGDTALGVGGELLASTVSSAVRQNGVIRNAFEDVFLRNRPPTMTPELQNALRQANIDPADFQAMTARDQRVTGRRLQAAQSQGGEAADTANQIARDTTDMRARGVEPNAFHVTPDADQKAIYAAAKRGDRGPEMQEMANALEGRTERGLRNFLDDSDLNVAGPNAVIGDQYQAVDEFGRGITRAADSSQQAAAHAVRNMPAYRPGVFMPDSLQALDRRLDNLIRGGEVKPDTAGAEAVREVRNWLRRVARDIEGTPAPEDAFNELRSRLSRDRAGEAAPDAIGVRNVINQLDDWFATTINQPRGTRYGMRNIAGGNPQDVITGRQAYAGYVADYVANRRVATGQGGMIDTAGSDVARVIERHASTPEQLAESLLGRARGLSASDRDTLNRLVVHLRTRIAQPGGPPAKGQSHTATSSTPGAADAWDALRQAIWRNLTRTGDDALRDAADIDRYLPTTQTMGHLFTRQERTILDAYRRMKNVVDSAGRDVRTAGAAGRADGGRLDRASKQISPLINYVFRYRAVRSVHDQNFISAIAFGAASLAPGRLAQWAERVAAGAVLRRAADPLQAIRGARSRPTKVGRMSGRAMAELLTSALPGGPQNENEQKFVDRINDLLTKTPE